MCSSIVIEILKRKVKRKAGDMDFPHNLNTCLWKAIWGGGSSQLTGSVIIMAKISMHVAAKKDA